MATIKKSEKPPYHISGHAIVTGKAKFIGDDIKPDGMLCAKPFPSEHAHAKIVSIDTSKAKKIPGVVAVLTWQDIPGPNQIGHTILDEPLLPQNEVMHVGQPVALIVAENAKIAAKAMKLITVTYKKLPSILTIDEALQAKSFYTGPQQFNHGDIKSAFKQAEFVITGEVNTGTQEHSYFETQRCWAIPGDDKNITLYSATQSTAEAQAIAARVLGLSSKDVTVDVKRLGGAFGGKERTATLWACLAALAAYVTKKPVELKLNRKDDMAWTGKRHPFRGKYKVGFNKQGRILAYELEISSNGGAFADLSIPVLYRAMFHADNAYYIPNVKITGVACKTNLPSNTAFRGFGAPQGIFIIENIIEKIAYKLKLDPIAVREINLYRENETTPYGQPVRDASHKKIFALLKQKTNYEKLRQEVANFNNQHQYLKRGIGIAPVKFGISFTFTPLNQGTALIWIYADGSIAVSHGGVEMGQEVNTKVAQVVAHELGVNLKRIRVESSNTQRNGNASPTAASTGSDINGNAALNAAQQLKERLCKEAAKLIAEKFSFKAAVNRIVFQDDQIFDRKNPDAKLHFNELIQHAYMQRINLGAQGFYKTPEIFYDSNKEHGSPFAYYVYGAALVQVEVDVLTGVNKLLSVQIIHQAGRSLNTAIDLGQIAGAFMQGYGYCTMEDMPFDKNGCYNATTFSTYKIPIIRDLPQTFAVDFIETDTKNASVMGSKAIGEPPLIYGEAAYFAIKNALQSIDPDHEVELAMPATPEAIALAANKQIKH